MCLLAVLVMLGGALTISASASALSQRGHVFSGTTIGGPGSGDGQLKEPGAVAVNEATGDVYVVDRGNNRIMRFAANGQFIAAWGYGVSDGAQTFEVCTSGCKAGTGKGALTSPGAIAVDNSSGPSAGAVYVVLDSRLNKGALWKFTAGGEKIKSIKQEGEEPKWEGALDGVAVDASGNLWVYRSAEEPTEAYVEGFDNKEELSNAEGQRANEYRFLQAEPTLESEVLIAAKEAEGLFCPKPGFAVDATAAHMYFDHERTNAFEECPEQRIVEETQTLKEEHINTPPLETLHTVGTARFRVTLEAEELQAEAQIGVLDGHNTTAVAVDLASGSGTPLGEIAKGDVYLATGATASARDSNGDLIQRLALPGVKPQADGVAIDSATGVLYVTDSANGQIDVFAPAPAGAPAIDSVLVEDLTPGSTRLTARVDANGAPTTVAVEYGEQASCAEGPDPSCTTVTLSPEALAGIFGDQTAEAVLTGLQPDTTYYYRLLATNANGSGESEQSPRTFFTTLPQASGVLADHRSWEMVSPPVKGGIIQALSLNGAAIQASEDGSSFTYGSESSGPLEDAQGNRSIAVTQLFSSRGADEWSTRDITTPHNKGEGVNTGQGETEEYRLFSSDLSLGLVEPELHKEGKQPFESPPLSPPAPEEQREKTIYLRADAPVLPGSAEKAIYEEAAGNREYLDPGYLPLLTAENNSGEVEGLKTKFGEHLEFVDATPDFNHVVFESLVPLTGDGASEGLYQWDFTGAGSAPRLVSVLPAGFGAAAAINPHLGGPEGPNEGGSGNSRHAISSNGTRTFFTSGFEENTSAYLFARDTSTAPAETVQINKVQGEHVSEPSAIDRESREVDETNYQTASEDGSKVFFTDTWPLTDDSTLHPTGLGRPADLYEYDFDKPLGERLTDLTVDDNPGERADVLGTIPGAAADGSYVYFVANGVLAPGAAPGHCAEQPLEEPQAGATCNLYLSAPDPNQAGKRVTRLIAVLSAEDSGDWALPRKTRVAENEADLSYLTSRVSPGTGEYLAFMSQQKLTDYNNEDASSSAPDEEVYLYNAKSGRLVCASCNPAGTRPNGVFDTENAGRGTGLLVDRPLIWKDRWLAGSVPGWTALGPQRGIYQSRYLSASGRLFFNSADNLVAQDENQEEDVYEFEPDGVGSCTLANGCVSLISSGSASSTRESAFMDASTNGDDVFFLTAGKLLAQDFDSTFDVYDARVCGTSDTSACLPLKPPPSPVCVGEECKPAAPAPPGFVSPATSVFSGPGNVGNSGVLPTKSKAQPGKVQPKISRGERLKKALKACRKLKAKKKRSSCEKKARRRYGPVKKHASKGRASARARGVAR